MRRFILVLNLLLAGATFCLATLSSFTEVTGAGTTVVAGNSKTTCAYVQIIAPAGNAAVVRVGDSITSATVGLPMAAGSGLRYGIGPSAKTPLSSLFFYIALNDKVDFACDN